MSAWAPPWDDDLPPAPAGANDPTPTPEGEGLELPGTKGSWGQWYTAKRPHDCARRSPYCPGEIGTGDTYWRQAVLERPKPGANRKARRGTVTVIRTCQACT